MKDISVEVLKGRFGGRSCVSSRDKRGEGANDRSEILLSAAPTFCLLNPCSDALVLNNQQHDMRLLHTPTTLYVHRSRLPVRQAELLSRPPAPRVPVQTVHRPVQ